MDAPREVYDDGRHALPGPHQGVPASFVPLRLCFLPERTFVTVTGSHVLVGRHSTSAIRLTDPEVSRHHCRLQFEQGAWHVVDLNSLNGVFVNGSRCTNAILYAGDELRLGGILAQVEAATPAPPARSDSAEHDVIKQIAASLPTSS